MHTFSLLCSPYESSNRLKHTRHTDIHWWNAHWVVVQSQVMKLIKLIKVYRQWGQFVVIQMKNLTKIFHSVQQCIFFSPKSCIFIFLLFLFTLITWKNRKQLQLKVKCLILVPYTDCVGHKNTVLLDIQNKGFAGQ